MNALVRAELLKLRTARSTIALVAVVLGLGLLFVTRVARAAGGAGGVTPGTADAWTQLLGSALSPTLLVLLVGVLAFTGEMRHGSLTPTLLVTPGKSAAGRSRRSLRRFWIARRVLSQGSYKAEQSLMFGTAGPRAQERTAPEIEAKQPQKDKQAQTA